MLNCVYLRSSRLKVLHFLAWYMHCQQGGEVWAWNGLLDAFRSFSGGFEPFLGSSVHQSDRSRHQSDRSVCWSCSHVAHRSDRWCWPVWTVRAELLQLPCLKWCFACIHPGGVASVQGELAFVQGSSLWFFELWFGGLRSLFEHSFVSDVLSRCPCLRGPRLVFFKWSCSLPLFVFRSLVGVFFICFFSFSFLSCYFMWVLSMHSSIGRLRTMCGSRTGGWSLSGVMSDWQRCVDWFLAKYCRCRLRLDWCWCRWRTSA
jgi:hypothetical protein